MRRVKAVTLARRNLSSFIGELSRSEPKDWPKFLSSAWTIIAKDFGKPDVARKTLIDTVEAAHTCAVAFSERTRANERTRLQREVTSAASKLSNLTRRVRAPVRNALDEVARAELREGHADFEFVANFLAGCVRVAETFPSVKDARTALGLLGVSGDQVEETDDNSNHRTPTFTVSNYEAMHPSARAIVEERLGTLMKDPSSPRTTSEIFSTIAASLTIGSIAEIRENGVDLLVAYVTNVANVWRRADLNPGRAWHPEDREYRSPFHRFVELVLIDQFDPRSRLFNKLDDRELMRNREFLASLPLDRDEREEAGIGPRYQWLISEHHIRAALKAIQKKSPKTP
jgi:hypothetical protein